MKHAYTSIVKEHLTNIQNFKDTFYKEKYLLEQSYNKKISIHEKALEALKNKYQDKAIEIAQHRNECPQSRWGHSLSPDDICVTENGIVLTWEEEHPYHASEFHSFTATWEELENSLEGEDNE